MTWFKKVQKSCEDSSEYATFRSHSLESLGVSESREAIADRLEKLNRMKGGSPDSALLPHFDRFMGEKKMHEERYTHMTSTWFWILLRDSWKLSLSTNHFYPSGYGGGTIGSSPYTLTPGNWNCWILYPSSWWPWFLWLFKVAIDPMIPLPSSSPCTGNPNN